MPKIFFCYRRDDSKHQAGRLFDHLTAHFGKGELFKDVDSIPLGLDFRKVLTAKVARCDVLLALISDDWVRAADASGARRLDDPNDFVRIEIESALRRNIPVIPVLVGQAPVPQADELPHDLRDLAFRHGMAVRADPDFHNDIERLVRGIHEVLTRKVTGMTTVSAAAEESANAASPPLAVLVASPPPDAVIPRATLLQPTPAPKGRKSWLIAAVAAASLALIAVVVFALSRGPRSDDAEAQKKGQKQKPNNDLVIAHDKLRNEDDKNEEEKAGDPKAGAPIDEDFHGRGLLLPDGWKDTESGRFGVSKDASGRVCLRVQEMSGEQFVQLPPMTLTNTFFIDAEFAMPYGPYRKNEATRALALELSSRKNGKTLRTSVDSYTSTVVVGDKPEFKALKFKYNEINTLRLERAADSISVDINKERVCLFRFPDLEEFDLVRIGFIGAETTGSSAISAKLYRLKVVPGGLVPEDEGPQPKAPDGKKKDDKK